MLVRVTLSRFIDQAPNRLGRFLRFWTREPFRAGAAK